MKAWYCTPYDDDYEGATVVWADTRGKARIAASCDLDLDYEITRVRAVRFPEADGLADSDLEPRWWLDRGFWVYCDGCSGSIHDHDDVVFVGNRAYCSLGCHAGAVERARQYQEQRMFGMRRRLVRTLGAITVTL